MHVRNIALITTILLCGPAIAQAPAPFAPLAIYTDPPADLAHPASTLAIEITSHGSVMNGLVYRPAGAGPFPLVVLMHGLPGNEQNLDLAQALRRAGWAVMTFHYRGSWGSEGQFSLDNVIEDAKVAVAHSSNPAVAKTWNIDPARIVVIGHSMGGLAAAKSSGSGPTRLATILIAPWDPSTLATLLRPMSPAQRTSTAQDRWGDVTHGRLTGSSSNEIAEQIIDHGEHWRLADAASGLARSPLLVVTAARDLASSKAAALKSALTSEGAKFDTIEIASNHTFDDRRIELETVVLDWLSRAELSPGPATTKTSAASVPETDRATLIAGERAWGQAYVTGDTETVRRLLANDFVGIGSDGSTYNKSAAIMAVGAVPRATSDVVDEPDVRLMGDTAVVQAHEHEIGPAPEFHPAERVFTDTWIKRGGEWQIVAAEDLDPGLPTVARYQGDIGVIKASRAANNRAIAAHDLTAFLAMFAEDAVFTWSNGTHAIAKKELAAFFRRDFADPNFDRYIRTPGLVSVSDRGTRALERGSWTALKKGTRYGGDYIAHWMKGSDGWHVVGELYVKLYCTGSLCTD